MKSGRVATNEIDKELDRLHSLGERWVPEWIANDICQRHFAGLQENDDALFWRQLGLAQMRDAVRQRIGARAGDVPDPSDPQLRLPGYEYLQPYYIVKRGKLGAIAVPIGEMTDREIDKKKQQLRTISTACADHALELDRYQDARRKERRRKWRNKKTA